MFIFPPSPLSPFSLPSLPFPLPNFIVSPSPGCSRPRKQPRRYGPPPRRVRHFPFSTSFLLSLRIPSDRASQRLAGYVRNEQIFVAEEMFDQMPERDVISWSILIMGYVQNGDLEKGLVLFSEMVRNGIVSVNDTTLVIVLSASAQLGLLEHGIFVHSIIKNVKFPLTMALGTTLVDMYAKCGCIYLARYVFDDLPKGYVFA